MVTKIRVMDGEGNRIAKGIPETLSPLARNVVRSKVRSHV